MTGQQSSEAPKTHQEQPSPQGGPEQDRQGLPGDRTDQPPPAAPQEADARRENAARKRDHPAPAERDDD